MGCHTWPPAASAPHMGVRATMSGPPSPAPGWHILIHERAWALSGQNYPYQNATINTFINPTSESAPFPSPQKKQSCSKINNENFLVCTEHLPRDTLKHAYRHLQNQASKYNVCSHWSPLIAAGSDMPVCHWSGSSLLLLMALWVMNSVSPRCW